jgi:hypothetical protein
MSSLASAPCSFVPCVRRRKGQRAKSRVVARAWWWSKDDGDSVDVADATMRDTDTPTTSEDTQTRADRVTLLAASYVNRRMPPPLPAGYQVRIVPDQTVGSTKTRIEVVWDGEVDEVIEDASDASTSDPPEKNIAVVGWVTCWPKNDQGNSLFLSSVEVKREHRRRGIAKRLLVEAEGLAVSKKCQRVALTVLKTNKPAILLYEKIGYAIENGDAGAVTKIAQVLVDPQKLFQHRMQKPMGL